MALVVTIIVLLILAGVTLFVVLGDDGIFSKTATAKYAQARATIEEIIELGRGYAETYRYENPNSYMDKLAEYLNNDNALKSISPNTSATKVEDYILLKVGDEFNYKITETETIFLGNKDEAEEALRPEVIDLKTSNIEFSYSTSAPTNGSVGVTITLKDDALALTQQYSGQIVLRYKIGQNGNWQDYTGTFNVSENCVIYPALYNGRDYSQTSVTGEVSNIDKDNPTSVSFTIDEVTADSIKVTAKASDGAGIKYFDFSSDGGTTYPSANRQTITTPTSGESTKTFTFTGLNDDTEYTIKVKATDAAGNSLESSTQTVTTKKTGPTPTGKKIIVNGTEIDVYAETESMGNYYAKTVNSFSSISGVSWKLLYDDELNYYLIASDFVPNELLPSELFRTTAYTNNLKNYGAYFMKWDSNLWEFTGDIGDKEPWKNASNSSTINNTSYLSWNGSDINIDKANKNMMAVAFMLDSTKWSNFAGNAEGARAFGGPTLEMFIKAYNVTHPNKRISTYDEGINEINSNSSGYKVKWESSSDWSNYISGIDSTGNFWCNTTNNRAEGMWLASPSSYGNYSLITTWSGPISLGCSGEEGSLSEERFGFRPIVSIPKF